MHAHPRRASRSLASSDSPAKYLCSAVCLGHQSIGEAFGGEIVRARRLMHGKTDMVHHDSRGLFAGLENPLQATRYHSLVIRPARCRTTSRFVPGAMAPMANLKSWASDHRRWPVHGLQFHPESFLTPHGTDMLRAFLAIRRPAVAAARRLKVSPQPSYRHPVYAPQREGARGRGRGGSDCRPSSAAIITARRPGVVRRAISARADLGKTVAGSHTLG